MSDIGHSRTLEGANSRINGRKTITMIENHSFINVQLVHNGCQDSHPYTSVSHWLHVEGLHMGFAKAIGL